MPKEMLIRDHDLSDIAEKIKVTKLDARRLLFRWPCGEVFTVRRVRLTTALDTLESTALPDKFRLCLVCEDMVMQERGMVRADQFISVCIQREKRRFVRVWTTDETSEDGALFVISDLREVTKL